MLATKSVTETKNSFAALQQEDIDSPDDSVSPSVAVAHAQRSEPDVETTTSEITWFISLRNVCSASFLSSSAFSEG